MSETQTELKSKKPIYTRPKFIAGCVVGVIFMILIIQNSQRVNFDVFFWEASVPAALLYLVFALLGFIVGFLLRRGRPQSKAKTS